MKRTEGRMRRREKNDSVFYHETLSKFRSAVWRSFPFALRYEGFLTSGKKGEGQEERN